MGFRIVTLLLAWLPGRLLAVNSVAEAPTISQECGFTPHPLYRTHNRTGSALTDSVLAWLTAGFIISRNGSANNTPAPFKKVRRGIRYESCLIYPTKITELYSLNDLKQGGVILANKLTQ